MTEQNQTIIDISPQICPDLAVWPGDTKLQRQVLSSIKDGANIDLSTLHATVHLGSHTDAPSHYHPDGQAMDQVDLAPYVGPCRVVTVTGKPLIEVDDCRSAVAAGAARILFRTLSAPDIYKFNTDFCAFSADAVAFMGKAGVCLIGIDTPSVDPFSSKDLPAHQALFTYQMRNLEGLVLSHVEDGPYELIALPLKLAMFDASPVRAVLRR